MFLLALLEHYQQKWRIHGTWAAYINEQTKGKMPQISRGHFPLCEMQNLCLCCSGLSRTRRKKFKLEKLIWHVLQYLSKWPAVLCDVLGEKCAKEGKNCSLWRLCQTCINRYLGKMMVVPAVWLQTATECSTISVTLFMVRALLWLNALYFLVAPSFSKHVVVWHQCTSFVTCSVGSLLLMKRSITCILKYVGA